MCEKISVWQTVEDIRKKYPKIFLVDGFTASFIGLLYDADLLWGKLDRTKRQVLILEESFLGLLKHIQYNHLIEATSFPGCEIKFSIPPYAACNTVKTWEAAQHWYTPTEILKAHPKLVSNDIFNANFLSQLAHKYIVRGKFDYNDKCTLILKPSFDELINYRNHVIQQKIVLLKDDNQA
jgi:hypothetical protein